MNEDGRMSVRFEGDITDLSQKMSQIQSGIKDTSNMAQTQSDALMNTIKKIGAVVGIGFGIGQVKAFMGQIINTRAEIQALEKSFETLAGKKIGNQLFQDIKQFATTTPMMMKDLARGAQTLLSFNYDAEKVMPTLRALGDISMGDSQRFNSLTLAFSQMSATGKLMGQDLLQMINAGFNPLSVMAQKTGKSVAELKDEMSKGAITAQMVEEAFMMASQEGGKFANMLETQSKTIGGAMSNLQGAVDDMFNAMGTSLEGPVTDTILWATDLVKNYKEVGKVLLEVAVAYGVYKAAVMANVAVENTIKTSRYADEAESLMKLLSAEKQAEISKLGLKVGTEEYLSVVKEQIAIEQKLAEENLATAQSAVTAGMENLSVKKEEIAMAKENVIAKQEALAMAVQEAEVGHSASVAKRLAVEEEALAMAEANALQMENHTLHLQYQRDVLVEQGASAELISAKGKEIAMAEKELATYNAEVQQRKKNIVAIQSETAEMYQKNMAKKVENAQTELNSAVEQVNTAVKNENTAAEELSAARTKVATAEKAKNTLVTGQQTAAETIGAKAKMFLKGATDSLKGSFQKLYATMMANPFTAIAAAVAAVGYGIYKLITYQSDYEKAQNKVNEAAKEASKTLVQEQKAIDRMFGALKGATEGSEQYKQAEENIIAQHGDYIKDLVDETGHLINIAEAYHRITEAAKESARERALQAANQENDSRLAEEHATTYEKLYKKLSKVYSGVELEENFNKIKVSLENKARGLKFDSLETILGKEGLKKFDSVFSYGGNALKAINAEYTESEINWKKINQDNERRYGTMPKKEEDESQDNANPVVAETAEEKKKREENEKKYAEARRKVMEDAHRAEMELKKSQLRDRLAEIDLEEKEELRAIKMAQEEYVKAQKENGIANPDVAGFTSQMNTAKQKYQLQRDEVQADYNKQRQAIENDDSMFKSKEEIEILKDRLAVSDTLTEKLEIQKELREANLALELQQLEYERQQELEQAGNDEEQKKIVNEKFNKKIEQTKLTDVRVGVKEESDIRLKAYQEYSDAVFAIEEKRKQEVEAIWKDNTLTTKEKKAKVAQVNEQAQSDTEEATAEILGEDIEGVQSELTNFASEMIGMSVEQLQTMIKTLKDDIKNTKGVDAEKAIILTKKLEQAEKQLATTSKKGKKEMTNEEQEYVSTLRETAEGLNESKEAVNMVADAIGEYMSDSQKDVVDTMRGVIDASLGMVTTLLTITAAGTEGIKAMETASVILAVISAAISLATALANAIMSNFSTQAMIRKEIEENNKAIERYKRSYDQLQRETDKKVGQTYFEESYKNLEQLQEALDKAEESVRLAQTNVNLASTKGKQEKAQEDLDAAIEVRNGIQDQIDETMQSMQEELLGDNLKSFASSLADSIVEGFDKGLNGMKDVWDKAYKNLMKAQMTKQLELFIQKDMQKMFDYMEKALENDQEITEDEYLRLNEMAETTKEAVEQRAEVYRQMMEKAGVLDIDQDADNNNAFGKMEQETAEELNGRFTAIQINSANIELKMEDVRRINNTMAEYTKDIRDVSAQLFEAATMQIAKLDEIVQNTAVLKDTNDKLQKIVTNTSRI